MGLRFRKSIKAGPVRINLSKSGVGYSVGTKGFRYTKKAGGGTRTTLSIPGTGISHVTETSKSATHSIPQASASNVTHAPSKKPKSRRTEFILCILLGWTGAHKFYMGKIGMGILYLLTFGLFYIGWIGDLFSMIVRKFSKNSSDNPKGIKKVLPYIAAALCALMLVSCGSSSTTPADPTEPNENNTEYTEEVTEETTDPATEPPTESLTEATEPQTEPPTDPPTDPPTEAPTEAPTDPPTEAPTEAPTNPPTEAPTEKDERTYVLNTNTKKFHYAYCSSADDIKASNRGEFTGTRDEVMAKGYEPCGRCHP